MKQTSLQGIANKAVQDKTYRFRNLFGLLTAGFLFLCWDYINRKAGAGVDRIDAIAYEENLIGNIQQLAGQVQQGIYRAKLILRKYIPKAGGKLRPLGIPVIADKLLQRAVAKILEAIYEQDFLSCSYGYRRGTGALKAIKDLTGELNSKKYHAVVEADIKGFFNNIKHDLLLEMLLKRIDDKPFLNLIRKWLKAGILETDGQVMHPVTGTPQGGVVSPILANIYLHYVLDMWFEETVRTHCKGHVYLCRYADDFVCAFQDVKDAERFYQALIQRLARFGLEAAEDKTQIMVFSHVKAKVKTKFEFLGFEFRWAVNYWGKPVLKRRTSRIKLRASIANFKIWFRKYSGLPKKILFAKLNRKLVGYYNYYGVTGNYQSLSSFVYQIIGLFFKWLNRRSQRKSYIWKSFKELVNYFGIAKPRILHAF
ncbi:MAG: group intron reverse transcriptase/maturase [Candidatus Brocadiaceae bacterium]|nr:group intron reverse transcriptase/maturase [Candidatus Brocadiaceae bacterium]